MDDTKYKLKLNGIVSDGKYTKEFTEKDVTHLTITEPNVVNINHALRLVELVKKKPHFNSDVCLCVECKLWRSNQPLLEEAKAIKC